MKFRHVEFTQYRSFAAIIQWDNVEIMTCIVKSCIYQFQQVVYYVNMFNHFGYFNDAE